MEKLPNELWLFIYTYLHKVDILYSFTDLNNRFQQLITSYQYDINLSDISYTLFKRFVYNVLPIYGENIRSFTLKNMHQINLCEENNVLHSMKNLQCLTFTTDHERDLESTEFWAKNFSHLKHLSELRINGWFDTTRIINNISAFVSSSLTHLTLLSSHSFQYDNHPMSIRNIKVLKIHLSSLYGIFNFIHDLHKLEELSLSVSDLSDYASLDSFIVPTSLIKLHFEFGRFKKPMIGTYFERLKNFLSRFQNQLQSLTLIVTSSESQFADFDQLQLLEKSLLHLTSFEYLIHTSHYPSDKFDHVKKLLNETFLIYTTKPHRPVSFAHRLRNDFNHEFLCHLQLNEIYNVEALAFVPARPLFPSGFMDISYNLPNLRYLSHHVPTSSNANPDDIKLFSSFLSLSPNLNWLDLDAPYSIDMINFLKHTSRSLRKINHMKCRFNRSFQLSFISELAQILPHLKYLYLETSAIDDYNQNDILQVLREVTDQIQKSFRYIIYYDVCTNIESNKREMIYEELKQWFHEQYVNMIFLENENRSEVSNATVFRCFF